MRLRHKKKIIGILAVMASLAVAFVLYSHNALGVEEVEDTFGDACEADADCTPLLCGDESTCVECREDSCSSGFVCEEGVCKEAEGLVEDENPLGNFPGEDFTFGDLIGVITGLACWLGRIATAVMVIFIALAGFRFMLARADPKAFSGAVANLKTVLWGILVIYGTYVIIATVANAVGITDFSFIPLVC